ncbi:MAG: rubredoxin [Cyclobacteriaceae bacterium]
MIEKADLVRVFVKGGIISPGDFMKIIETTAALGTDYIHLGSRQDILFPVKNKNANILEKTFSSINTLFDTDGEAFHNIVSSYPSLDVMPTTHWLASHTYHYILDTFDYQPKLKINITDPVQSLVPLFTGNINFVASHIENYWYLYLRFSEWGQIPWCAPDLIYSYDLSKLTRQLENNRATEKFKDYSALYDSTKAMLEFNHQNMTQELDFPEPNTLYYEGMNRIMGGKYWLGLYWRNNQFNINFLKALCQLCMDTDIGKISLTPWKSIIVKGIAEQDRLRWEKLLGKFGINIRHSSLELNWHLPVMDEEALVLKKYLVRALDKVDISTYGLSFSVKTQHMVLFTSVAIEKEKLSEKPEENGTFNILYAKDFKPNGMEYLYYVRGVTKETIPSLLIELSHKYYDQLAMEKEEEKHPDFQKVQKSHKKFQCNSCLTVYDEKLGDPESNIPSGTPFLSLTPDYCCPICENPKSAFKRI